MSISIPPNIFSNSFLLIDPLPSKSNILNAFFILINVIFYYYTNAAVINSVKSTFPDSLTSNYDIIPSAITSALIWSISELIIPYNNSYLLNTPSPSVSKLLNVYNNFMLSSLLTN